MSGVHIEVRTRGAGRDVFQALQVSLLGDDGSRPQLLFVPQDAARLKERLAPPDDERLRLPEARIRVSQEVETAQAGRKDQLSSGFGDRLRDGEIHR